MKNSLIGRNILSDPSNTKHIKGTSVVKRLFFRYVIEPAIKSFRDWTDISYTHFVLSIPEDLDCFYEKRDELSRKYPELVEKVITEFKSTGRFKLTMDKNKEILCEMFIEQIKFFLS